MRERGQGSHAGLDRAHVVQVALELLDDVGLDDLTMRRLADRLGVTAASLYWHVRDKDQLLALLADAISAQMPAPGLARPWREELTTVALAVRRIALAHRDAARVLAASLPISPHRLQRLEALFAVLRRAGFAPADIADASCLLNIYVMGFVLDEVLSPQQPLTGSAGSARTGGDVAPNAPPSGRLVLEHGASNVTIRAGGALHDLYRLTCEGRTPTVVDAQDGTVRLWQRRGRGTSCVVALTDGLPWDVAIAGGAFRVYADLSRLRLQSFRIIGRSSEITVQLPLPSGIVPLHIDGSVHAMHIARPPGAAIRVQLRRSSRHLMLDGLQLDWAGAGAGWESANYEAATDRFDIEICGSADALTLTTINDEPDQGSMGGDRTIDAQVRDWFATQSPEEYPNLVALADQLAHPDQDRRFHAGLQILLDGLERRLEQRSTTGPERYC